MQLLQLFELSYLGMDINKPTWSHHLLGRDNELHTVFSAADIKMSYDVHLSGNLYKCVLNHMVCFVTAIKSEIIEELEKHRDAELAEQREKRHKAEAEKACKTTEQSTSADEAKVLCH